MTPAGDVVDVDVVGLGTDVDDVDDVGACVVVGLGVVVVTSVVGMTLVVVLTLVELLGGMVLGLVVGAGVSQR